MADGAHGGSVELRLAVATVFDFVILANSMRDDEREQFVAFAGAATYDADVAARAMIGTRGPSYSLLADGVPVLCGGFMPIGPGVVEGWMAGPLSTWARFWRPLTRLARTLIAAELETSHRVQVCALASRTAAHDWYRRGLGLAEEGRLRCYTATGEDAIMFAKVRE